MEQENTIPEFACEIEVTTTNRLSIALQSKSEIVTLKANTLKELNKSIRQFIKKHTVTKFENGILVHCVECNAFHKYHRVQID